MKRFKSILCASLLTLSMSSAALAGNISGGKAGNISGGKAGNISGGAPSNIAVLTDQLYSAILGLLIP